MKIITTNIAQKLDLLSITKSYKIAFPAICYIPTQPISIHDYTNSKVVKRGGRTYEDYVFWVLD